MSNDIKVGTGIGKIENNYGTINIEDKNTDETDQIRKDFSSVSDEIFKFLKIAEILKSYDQDWSDLKHKEDFQRVYSLEYEIKEPLENLYADGRPLASELEKLLFNINAYVGEYPTLTSSLEAIEKYWVNEERINEYKKILELSNKAKVDHQIDLYSINAMQRLFQKQIEHLEQIQVIVRMLKRSDLYQKENHIENSKVDINNAPEKIKNFVWFYNLSKRHPVQSFVFAILLVGFYFLSPIYSYIRDDFGISIFKIEATQEEKIKMKHVFQVGDAFVSLFHEMADNKTVDISINRNALQEHFSALNFDGNKLFIEATNPIDWLKNYNDTRASFEGYIDRNFPKYRLLYDTGVNLSTYIKSGELIFLEDFIKSWTKFQESNNLSTPNFDTSKIKSTNDAIKIYLEIQKWLNK